MRYLLLILILLFFSANIHGQVVKSVVLDSVMVEAVKKGFDVADFIEMVKADTSFLRGFRNLRNAPHSVKGEMLTFNRKKTKKLSGLNRNAKQMVVNNKRWIEVLSESTTGNFYNRKNEPNTYTAELFDDIFFYQDTLPLVPVYFESHYESENKSNISKLKTLVFSPGSEVSGVPLIGKRLAIFSDDMIPYYDYSIRSVLYEDSIPCYVFSCSVKKDAGSYPVLQYLNTWFDKRTFSIVYRDYKYHYSGLLFSFDVTFKIRMGYQHYVLYPNRIEYSGFWDIPFKKQETADFKLDFAVDKELY